MIGTVGNVSQVPLGFTLSANAALAATLLNVSDTADLDEDGGTLVGPDGSQYTYSAPNEIAGTVTITPGLVVAALEDDFFAVFDPETNSNAVELRADVDPTSTEGEDGDSISARVTHVLQPYLPTGIRNPGAGEPVTLELVDDEWVVTDVVGRQAQLDGSYLRPGTIMEGSLGFTFGGTTVSIGLVAPTSPAVGDIWFDSGNGNVMKQWDGAAWNPYQWDAVASLVPGSITAPVIAAGAITSDLIAANAIVAGAIATGALDAYSITTAFLSAISMSGAVTASRIDKSDFIIDNFGGHILVYQRSTTAVTFDTVGAGTWSLAGTGIVAGDVITIECWGGAQGGASGDSYYGGVGVGVIGDGVGGQGGHYARVNNYVVTAADVTSGISYAIGAGGAGGVVGGALLVAGQPGGQTSFGPCSAKGGKIWYGNGVDAGDVIFTSPGGGNLTGLSSGGTPQNTGGGGGSAAAGTFNNGAAGHTGSQGSGTQPGGAGGVGANGGGSGGAGGASNAVGSAGVVPGGGGGGGGWVPSTSTGKAGAAGAHGRAIATYGRPVLLMSISGSSGTDVFGNAYPQGVMIYPNTTTDWNTATTPGPFLGVAGAQTNSPDDTKTWTGQVYGRQSTGSLVQVVNRLSTADAPEMFMRQYNTSGGWKAWHRLAGAVQASEYTNCTGTSGYTPNGSNPAQVYMDTSGRVFIRGRMDKNSGSYVAGSATNFMTLPTGFTPAKNQNMTLVSGNGDTVGSMLLTGGSNTVQYYLPAGSSVVAVMLSGSWQT